MSKKNGKGKRDYLLRGFGGELPSSSEGSGQDKPIEIDCTLDPRSGSNVDRVSGTNSTISNTSLPPKKRRSPETIDLTSESSRSKEKEKKKKTRTPKKSKKSRKYVETTLSEVKDNNPLEKFRAQWHHWFITAPRCTMNPETAKERILKTFEKWDVQKVVVGAEKHKDGYPHLHAYVHCKGLPDFKGPSGKERLDSIFGVKCSYEGARNWKKTISYCTKNGVYVQWGVDVEAVLKAETSKKSVKFETFAKLALEGKTYADMVQEDPGFSMKNQKVITDFIGWVNLNKVSQKKEWKGLGLNPTCEHENHKKLCDWVNGAIKVDRPRKSKQLFLYGPADTGKTFFLEKLRERLHCFDFVDGENWDTGMCDRPWDLLVWDDFAGFSKGIGYMKKILEGQTMQVIQKCRVPQMKTLRTPCIFAANNDLEFYLGMNMSENDKGAFKSRFVEIEVTPETALFDCLSFIDEISIEQPLVCGTPEVIDLLGEEEERDERPPSLLQDSYVCSPTQRVEEEEVDEVAGSFEEAQPPLDVREHPETSPERDYEGLRKNLTQTYDDTNKGTPFKVPKGFVRRIKPMLVRETVVNSNSQISDFEDIDFADKGKEEMGETPTNSPIMNEWGCLCTLEKDCERHYKEMADLSPFCELLGFYHPYLSEFEWDSEVEEVYKLVNLTKADYLRGQNYAKMKALLFSAKKFGL